MTRSSSVDLGAAQRRLENASRTHKSARTKRIKAEEAESVAHVELREAEDQFNTATKAVLNGIGR